MRLSVSLIKGMRVKLVASDETNKFVDFWMGYQRERSGRDIDWSIPLDVRHVFPEQGSHPGSIPA